MGRDWEREPGFLDGDENVLKMTVVIAVQLCEYIKTIELYTLKLLILWP